MCFVSLVSLNLSRTAPARAAVVRRAHWLRLFALLLTVLGLAAQQRVLTPAVRASTSVVRLVAERVQSIETHAVRAEPALRVAAAPVFARVPWFSEPIVSWPRLSHLRACLAPPSADRLRASISHFHSKRRIPRMNSEEPPRA
ncbi:MAG: hypothetical protein WDO74_10480 [Pseudomonadota bacterium]